MTGQKNRAHSPGAPGRRRWIIVAAAATLTVAGVAGVLVLAPRDDTTGASQQEVAVATQTVERRDLTEAVTTQATLDFGGQHPLTGNLGGTITWLPRVGEVIDRGGRIYAIDNTAIVLMFGQLPAWRGFDLQMTDGPDVAQLEDNLAALGFFAGTPDQTFDWVTREAVCDWQESLGMPGSGAIEFGRIVFATEPRRIGSVNLAVGDGAGPGTAVMTLTSQTKVVTAQLRAADQQLAVTGAPVSIRLPGGQNTTGTVSTVATPIEIDNPDGKQVVVPVVISLDDATATGDLQRVTVTAGFVQKTYAQVLAVPVTALIALPGGRLGVEKVTLKGLERVAVTTGVFVQGYVEITGGDLAEGDEVVAP